MKYRSSAIESFLMLSEPTLNKLKMHTNYLIEDVVYKALKEIPCSGHSTPEVIDRITYVWKPAASLKDKANKPTQRSAAKVKKTTESTSTAANVPQESTSSENENERSTNYQEDEDYQAGQYEEEGEEVVEENEDEEEDDDDDDDEDIFEDVEDDNAVIEPEIEDENAYGDGEGVYESMYKNLETESSFHTVIEFVKGQLKKPKLVQEKAVMCADLFVLITKKDSQNSNFQALSKEMLFDLLSCESVSCWCDKYVFCVSSLIKVVESFSAQSIESFAKILFNLCKNNSNNPDIVKFVEKINNAFVPKIEDSLDSLSQKLFKLVLEDATSDTARVKQEMGSAYSYMLIRMINFDKLTKSNLIAAKKHVVPMLVKNIDTHKCLCLPKLLSHPLCILTTSYIQHYSF